MAKIKRDEEAIHYALKVLSGKWRLIVLWEIYNNNSIRFNQMERNIEGISSIMLTRVLKELMEHGLITRKQYDEVPPRVEYAITERGLKLCPVLTMLEDFGKEILIDKR